MRRLTARSPLAYLFLAFIAMAGLSYINYMPGVVSALAGGLGFTDVQAGQIVAANGYGGILGSTAAIFLVRRILWQRALFGLLAVLVAVDLGTLWTGGYEVMLVWRFLAGTVGGLCVGIAFSVLARLDNPDRAFGLLLFVQFSIGSMVIAGLPGLEAQLGAHAVFGVMAGITLLSLLLLAPLPALANDPEAGSTSAPQPGLSGNALLLLSAILLYQCGASAIWAYVGLIGQEAGIQDDSVSLYIAGTGMLGLLGAALPVMTGNRWGRLLWVVAGVALSLAAAVMLRSSQIVPLYVGSMALLFFSWPAVQSFLLAVTAEMDPSGRLSTAAAVVSSVGLASGPLLASSLLGDGNFATMLLACAAIFGLSLVLLLRPVQAFESAVHDELVRNSESYEAKPSSPAAPTL